MVLIRQKKIRWNSCINWIVITAAALLLVAIWTKPSMSAQEKPRAPETIQFYTTPSGSTGHVTAVGISEMLRKHSSWLRATVEATWGADVMKLWHREPNRKKTGVGNMFPANIWLAETKLGITDTKALVVCRIGVFVNPWVTYNPKIKSAIDFAGKRVVTGVRGSGIAMDHEYILREIGVWEKIKIEHMPWDQSKDAFLDGTVDVAYTSANVGDDKAMPIPAAMEIALSRKPFNVIGIEQEWVDKVRAKTGYPVTAVTMPPGSLGKYQPKDILANGYISAWYASKEVSEDIIYEVCRVIWDHLDELSQYHATIKLLNRKNIANVSHPESEFHPGALKFFKEEGVKIGR